MNSKEKGARGEREFAKALSDVLGVKAYRSRQYKGSSDSPDVLTGLSGVHFEVKRVEKLRIKQAMAQAVKDAGENIPVVAFRSNRQKWILLVYLDDIYKLSEIIVEKCQSEDSHAAAVQE